jgi:hypothetical protein
MHTYINSVDGELTYWILVKLEKVMFMNDSRYANERMFTDKAEHHKILDQWEADVPSKFKSAILYAFIKY